MNPKKVQYLKDFIRFSPNVYGKKISVPQLKSILGSDKDDFEEYVREWQNRFGGKKDLFNDKSLYDNSFVIFNADLDGFYDYLVKELEECEICSKSISYKSPKTWKITRIFIFEQGIEKPRTLLQNSSEYNYNLIAHWSKKGLEFKHISDTIDHDVFYLYNQFNGEKFSGWQEEPKCWIDHEYGNVVNLIFSSGGEHQGIITENLFLWIEWNTDMQIFTRVGKDHIFHPEVITKCEELFSQLIHNNIPELLFALTRLHKPSELSSLLKKIVRIINKQDFESLTVFKNEFQHNPIIHKILYSQQTPYSRKVIDWFQMYLLDLGTIGNGIFDEDFIVLNPSATLRFDGFYILYQKTRDAEISGAHIIYFRPDYQFVTLLLHDLHQKDLENILQCIKSRKPPFNEDKDHWKWIEQCFGRYCNFHTKSGGNYYFNESNTIKIEMDNDPIYTSFCNAVINANSIVLENKDYEFIPFRRNN